jgi:hypothetical protein
VGDGGLSAVSDAGPIIHLAEIDCLGLLSILNHLHVPDAVWMETVGRDRVSPETVLGLENVRRHSLPQPEVARFVERNNLEALHDGEREGVLWGGAMAVS